MEIVYAATTDTATFLLDADGICRWVTAAPGVVTRDGDWPGKSAAERCVGAQYVASLDVRVKGGLIDLPQVGSNLVFAAVDPTGRISLIRTGPLVKFQTRRRRDSSGVHERPVESERAPSTLPMPRSQRPTLPSEPANVYESELATTRFFPDQMMAVHQAARALPRQRAPMRTPLPPPAPPPRRAPPPHTHVQHVPVPAYDESIPTQARIDVREVDLPAHVHQQRMPGPEAYRGTKFSKRRMG